MSNNLATLQVFTQDSVNRLREFARTSPFEFYAADPKETIDRLKLVTIGTKIQHSQTVFSDREPDSTPGKADIENSISALAMLPGLTPAQAADDRIWVTLAFRDYSEYTHKRFPLRAKQSDLKGTKEMREKVTAQAQRHVINHTFADSVRLRTRDNAISRLWWMGHYAESANVATTREVLKHLVGYDLDIASNLLGRTHIASAPSIAGAILTAMVNDTKFESRDPSPRRESFRHFMKEIDLLAGRRVLSFLSREEIQPEIDDLYSRHFND